MKHKLILQIMGSLFGLFVIGGFCGYALAARAGGPSASPAFALPKSEEIWLEKRYQETVARVGLSPEQAEKLRGHYQKLTAEIREIRENTSRQLGDAFARHKETVLPDLNPEQRERYEALVSERRAARGR